MVLLLHCAGKMWEWVGPRLGKVPPWALSLLYHHDSPTSAALPSTRALPHLLPVWGFRDLPALGSAGVWARREPGQGWQLPCYRHWAQQQHGVGLTARLTHKHGVSRQCYKWPVTEVGRWQKPWATIPACPYHRGHRV